jgi:hypothetical protein
MQACFTSGQRVFAERFRMSLSIFRALFTLTDFKLISDRLYASNFHRPG